MPKKYKYRPYWALLMDATGLENRLNGTITNEQIETALHVKSSGSFLRYHKDLALKLEEGSLTVGEFIDRILWGTTYDPQMVTNIFDRLGMEYEVGKMVAYAARYARNIGHVNGNRELDPGIFSGSKVLPVALVHDMEKLYGGQIDRTHGLLYAIAAHVQNNSPKTPSPIP
jgi:hypothetical protein